ncbi:hypothetical protein BH23GEM2_BH23GEM2_16580 [soil metagenome]
MLLHAAANNTKYIVPSSLREPTAAFSLDASLVAWLTVAALWVAAGYFLYRMRETRTNLTLEIH